MSYTDFCGHLTFYRWLWRRCNSDFIHFTSIISFSPYWPETTKKLFSLFHNIIINHGYFISVLSKSSLKGIICPRIWQPGQPAVYMNPPDGNEVLAADGIAEVCESQGWRKSRLKPPNLERDCPFGDLQFFDSPGHGDSLWPNPCSCRKESQWQELYSPL